MYENELMMGVIVASTAFCGLTGVVIGQVKEAKMSCFMIKPLKIVLSISFLCGVLAVLLAIIWFPSGLSSTEWHSPTILSPWLLFMQIIFFMATIVDFWLFE